MASKTPIPDLTVGRFRVHLVQEGDRQRINDCRLHGHGLPFVEFYDMAQDPMRFPGGQFVTRYYMSTLLGMDDYRDSIGDFYALGLDGGVPEWTISGNDLQEVYQYLCKARDTLQGSRSDMTPDKDTPISPKDIAKESREASQALAGRSPEFTFYENGGKSYISFGTIDNTRNYGALQATHEYNLAYCVDDRKWIGDEISPSGWDDLDAEKAAELAEKHGLTRELHRLQKEYPDIFNKRQDNKGYSLSSEQRDASAAKEALEHIVSPKGRDPR